MERPLGQTKREERREKREERRGKKEYVGRPLFVKSDLPTPLLQKLYKRDNPHISKA
jgi:hypothetical protein